MKILNIITHIVLFASLLSSQICCIELNYPKVGLLLLSENVLLNNVRNYLSNEEQRITRLRQLSHELTHLHESVMKDKDLHLGHPIGVYKLIQRMAIEWREVDDRVKPNRDLIQIISQYMQQINTIHNYSLSDAVSGVINLVKTYKLDVGLMSTGLIEYMATFGEHKVFTQTDTSNMLTSFDCFTIGRQSYDSQQYMDSIQWLETALMRASIEDSGVSMELRADILKYMSLSYYKLKDYEEAINYMKESMNITVDSDDNHLNELSLELMNISNDYEEEEEETQNANQELDKNIKIHQELCRGIQLLNQTLVSQLKCYHLNTSEIPFLRLTRIKVEEMYKIPDIIVIHEFLSEFEITLMKALSGNNLNRMSVVDKDTGAYIRSDDRLADGSWLKDSQHPLVAAISRRMSAITGLDMSTAEDMNVIRYSVGGYYGHHYDSFHMIPGGPVTGPQRIATWISYLSDVYAGGATVFKYIC